MPEFVIEKDFSGLGRLSSFQQQQTARRTCSALHGVAPGIEWVQSYLTPDKVYCVYRAPSEAALRDEITRWGLEQPRSICEVHQIISPADEPAAEERAG
jgi:hypothetical protein